MATYKADHLKVMIREVVRQELREQVAAVISEVLAEKFLRQLAESAAAAQPRGVAHLHIQGDDDQEEEETPSILSNDILGVGQENPRFKKVPKSDGVRQFGENNERNEMLSLFFEGTQPVPKDDSVGMPSGVSLDIDKPAVKELASNWVALAEGMDRDAARKKVQVDPAAEEARLKRLRDSLDVPANR
jgi:hypothetical protein